MSNIKRNNYLDIVKGIAIILMVLGHCIQYGSGSIYYNNNLFFENLLFKIIYSFHMPLFMLVSGYLFFNTLKNKSLKNIVNTRFKRLIVPIIIWSLIPIIIFIIKNYSKFEIIYFIKSLIKIVINNLWFLWALFYCSVIVSIINKLFKDNVLIYLIIILLMFITTDIMNLSMYKFMFPYFLIGYFANKNDFVKQIKNIFKSKESKIIIVSFIFVVFVTLLLFFNLRSYVYVTGVNIYGSYGYLQIYIDLYRWIIGLFGSCLMLLIIYFLHMRIKVFDKPLIYLGKMTLAIYAIDAFINTYILQRLTCNLNYQFSYVLIETFMIIIICIFSDKFYKEVITHEN